MPTPLHPTDQILHPGLKIPKQLDTLEHSLTFIRPAIQILQDQDCFLYLSICPPRTLLESFRRTPVTYFSSNPWDDPSLFVKFLLRLENKWRETCTFQLCAKLTETPPWPSVNSTLPNRQICHSLLTPLHCLPVMELERISPTGFPATLLHRLPSEWILIGWAWDLLS